MTTLVRSPELTELRAFCAAVDLGSIGRAARLLRVSQPALSKRLRALEAIAGARLLERSTRGVKPTAAGVRLYAEARKVVADAESVEMLMGGLSQPDGLPIRLASSPTVAEFMLPGPLVEFEGLHSRHVNVELFIANSYVVRELVRDGRADSESPLSTSLESRTRFWRKSRCARTRSSSPCPRRTHGRRRRRSRSTTSFVRRW